MPHTCKVCPRTVASKNDAFCCRGCEAVWAIIEKMQLSGKARADRIQALLKGVFPDEQEIPLKESSQNNRGREQKELQFLIGGMVCPACSWLIHNSLVKIAGVEEVNVNFISESCNIKYDPMQVGWETIERIIESLGYQCLQEDLKKPYDFFRFGVGWFLALNTMMLSFVVYAAETYAIPDVFRYLCSFLLLIFASLVPLYAVRPIIKSGIQQLLRLDFKMESLIVLSTGAAWIYSIGALFTGHFSELYFDIVAVLLMVIETGNLISGSFYRRLYQRITSIRLQLPKKVELLTGSDEYKSVDEIEAEEEFVAYQNESLPTDGILLDEAEFDFSLMTGEARPILLKKGQFVGAGSKVLSEKACLKVPSSGRSSLVERMIEATISAFNTKKDEPSLGDKISRIFVPTVMGIALLVFFYQSQVGSFHEAFLTFLCVLIVACPCAFGIAEPLVLASGTWRLRNMGIQIFNGSALSFLPDLVVFDKTGTLTQGSPQVKSLQWLVPENQKDLNTLASLESGLEHPVAKALTSLGEGEEVQDRVSVPTRVSGIVDGTTYQAGSPALYPDVAIPDSYQDSTVVLFGTHEQCLLILELEDKLRDEAREVIDSLRSQKMETLICSGDREGVVKKIARQLEIEHYYYERDNEQKKDLIAAFQAQGKKVMMVGDGINDSGALALSDLGLALFSGQLPSQMSADGVFLKHGIRSIKWMPPVLRVIRRKIFLNYMWSFLYNGVGIALASLGLLSPKYCAVGMAFSNFVVIFNSLYGFPIKREKVSPFVAGTPSPTYFSPHSAQ